MLTPVSMNCFWMVFHDCTSTITSRSVRGWTGRSALRSSGPAPIRLLDRTISSTLDRWRRRDLRPPAVDVVDAAGAQRRNGLDASNHAKQHIAVTDTDSRSAIRTNKTQTRFRGQRSRATDQRIEHRQLRHLAITQCLSSSSTSNSSSSSCRSRMQLTARGQLQQVLFVQSVFTTCEKGTAEWKRWFVMTVDSYT